VERLEIEEHLWLPDHPDNRVAATLTFEPADGSELALIGALDAQLQLPVSPILGPSNVDECG
jgi:hypothetical protein